MSGNRLIKNINNEIKSLNEIIDLKIIKGFSYAREARRHKLLLKILRETQGLVERSSARNFVFSKFLF